VRSMVGLLPLCAATLFEGKVLAKYPSPPGAFITADLFIETLYNELTATPGGKPVRHN